MSVQPRQFKETLSQKEFLKKTEKESEKRTGNGTQGLEHVSGWAKQMSLAPSGTALLC